MSLLDEDAEPTLQVSPGALLSDEPRSVKESKKERRKGGGLSLGRTKPRDSGTEKASKKGKHARSKSGSRTPPDSPRADRASRGGRNQPSPNVKGHRKRYSQLGFNLSAEESEGEEEEEAQTYFANQAVSEAADNPSSQEPFFSIEKETLTDQPTSPGPRSTVQFPVQFGEAGSVLFPSSAFEPHPPPPQPSGDEQSLFPPAPQPDVGPWTPSDPPAPLSDSSAESAEQEVQAQKIPEAEWRLSTELQSKCHKQFVELQPTRGLLQGNQARTFFVQSRLPNADLSAIWRLADMDRDNALSEQEFCVAMKLVLLRRKGYSLPVSLPHTLMESIAEDSHSSGRKIAPLETSKTVAELPVSQPCGHPSLSEISQHSQPELHQPSPQLVDLSDPPSSLKSSDSLTAVEREEPAVATIISLAGEKEEEEEQHKPLYHSFTENVSESSSSHKSVRRARSLKLFTPPPSDSTANTTPPHSPFSPGPSSETEPIISLQNPTPKANPRSSKEKAGYQILPAGDEETTEEDRTTEQLAIGRDRGHGRSTSLDLKKMIAGSDVLSDMPAAEPPRPPPKPVTEDGDLLPQVRGRSASTGSISSTGAAVSAPAMDTTASALLLSGTSRPAPVRKAPLLPPAPKPRRPPPPRREEKPDNSSSLLRNKSELQTTIRSLKDTNATLQSLNRELEEKLFALMEDRVQLARELELSRQMQMSA